MSEELKAALARIACLEGEIAKRDARIVELESRYQRDVYGLNNEGDPIGGDPAGGYANDNARLRSELAAIKAQEPVAEIALSDDGYKIGLLGALRNHRLPIGTKLYAAPVSEAKAQGVVMLPSVAEVMNIVFDYQHNKNKNVTGTTNWAANIGMAVIDAVVRLNAAPAAPAADAWIQVSERLPEVESRLDQECRAGTLSIAPLNVSAAVLVFDGEKVRSTRLEWFDGCLPLPYCITHWMPLPAAPAAHSAKGVV